MNRNPSYKIEAELIKNGVSHVFGIDEVGRGSFAGPLVASAVCFNKKFKWFKKIKDSKLLTHKQRYYLSKLINKNTINFTEIINVETINKIGIEKSNILIFGKLISTISSQFPTDKIHHIIDGRKKKIESTHSTFVIGGDAKSISIAAASIIAKVYRDKMMRSYGKLYKGYNFYKNKGYGTKFHRNAIKKRGLSKIHRKNFSLEYYLIKS